MTKEGVAKTDVYTRVTDKTIADLEQGVRPWMKTWNAEHAAGRITRPLLHNGQPYNGINILMLWSAAVSEGYGAPIWMTFRQAKELGGHIRKGEKGELVVYANTITRTETDAATGEDIDQTIPFMKGYTVFNVDQIEALPDHYYQLAEPVLDLAERIEHAEQFFAATGADIRHGGNQAFCNVTHDRIQLPPFESFRDAESRCQCLVCNYLRVDVRRCRTKQRTATCQKWPKSSSETRKRERARSRSLNCRRNSGKPPERVRAIAQGGATRRRYGRGTKSRSGVMAGLIATMILNEEDEFPLLSVV